VFVIVSVQNKTDIVEFNTDYYYIHKSKY